MNIQNDTPTETEKIKKAYTFLSKIYSSVNPLVKKVRARSIELASIQPDDRILEVAVGMGDSFLEFLKRVDSKNKVYGVDLTPAMLNKTRRLATEKGFSNFDLKETDGRRLPFPDETFDVLYNSYVLNYIPLTDFPVVFGEFKRVLKKGGRLVSVNLSKKDDSLVFYERVYNLIPFAWGGRPVLIEPYLKQAGFREVKREMLLHILPSEIVTALK